MDADSIQIGALQEVELGLCPYSLSGIFIIFQ